MPKGKQLQNIYKQLEKIRLDESFTAANFVDIDPIVLFGGLQDYNRQQKSLGRELVFPAHTKTTKEFD